MFLKYVFFKVLPHSIYFRFVMYCRIENEMYLFGIVRFLFRFTIVSNTDRWLSYMFFIGYRRQVSNNLKLVFWTCLLMRLWKMMFCDRPILPVVLSPHIIAACTWWTWTFLRSRRRRRIESFLESPRGDRRNRWLEILETIGYTVLRRNTFFAPFPKMCYV